MNRSQLDEICMYIPKSINASNSFTVYHEEAKVDEAHEAVGAPLSERPPNGGGGHLL